MRFVILAACAGLLACTSTVQAQDEPTASERSQPTFDAALAERLGADERGMRQYVLVILKTGPNTGFSEHEREGLFNAHMANIGRLAQRGSLVVAGPLDANERQYRGLFILNAATLEEADQIVGSDPAVAAGLFAYEAYRWYGSAALMEVPALHERLQH